MLTIAIIDTDKVLRHKIIDFFENMEGLVAATGFRNTKDFLDQEMLFRIILMAVNGLGQDVLRDVLQIKTKYPKTELMMLAEIEDIEIVISSLQAGACGYVLKTKSLPNFKRSVFSLVKTPASDALMRLIFSY